MALRHKHLKIDQDKLDQARAGLKAPTEQETIDKALDALLAELSITRTLRSVRGVGGFVDPFKGRKR
jgi:hypothetical protein